MKLLKWVIDEYEIGMLGLLTLLYQQFLGKVMFYK